jgi:lipopolysaccharide export system protein LptA
MTLHPRLIVRLALLLSVTLAALAATPEAYAEKADRAKPIEIDAASATTDLANNVQVLEGNVVLVQGTMRITADRMRVRRDAQDHIFAELSGVNGNQIRFREKREGFNDFIEGTADRAEFDDKANTVKLFSKAKLKSGGDELSGEYIYYNSLTEVIQALGNVPDPKADVRASRPATSEGSRVRIVIQPRSEPPKAAAEVPQAAGSTKKAP